MAAQFFRKLFRKASRPRAGGPAGKSTEKPDTGNEIYTSQDLKGMAVSPELDKNLAALSSMMGQSGDLVFRKFRLGMDSTEAALIYIDGLVDKNVINNSILKPLMLEYRMAWSQPPAAGLAEKVKNFALTTSNATMARDMGKLVESILYGGVAVAFEGLDTALLVDTKGWNIRGIAEPTAEVLVRGPREGFTEDIRTNTTLIRRRLRSPNLVLEEINVGRVTSTGVTIAYLRGMAAPEILAEVRTRLQQIDIDGVLESGYLEEYIEDSPYSPFPQVLHTERPDRVAGALLEGRVAILTDGTPIVLIVPGEFITYMQSPEDYYERAIISTAIRWVRYVALGISLLLPSLYIAITTFHQEMIPTRLLISMAAAREGVPFPALVEALLMEFTFEALREAGIRLPRAVGQAVSIVGALVIGQSAVQAGIVSPLMVIVVALTGIASFANPAFNMALATRFLRFPIMILAGTLGLFGVMAGLLAILIHTAGLRSFGVPYLASMAPLHTGDLKDVVIRAPWWAMDKRPTETGKMNRRRQSPGLRPSPPKPPGDRGGEGQ